MTDYSARNVDEYILNAANEAKPHLNEIREVVKSTVPEAEEGLSYGKPFYKYKGMLAGFDAYKNHIGFELWIDRLQEEDRKILEKEGYKTGLRTFQIRFDQKVPTAIIKKLLKEQMKINEAKKK